MFGKSRRTQDAPTVSASAEHRSYAETRVLLQACCGGAFSPALANQTGLDARNPSSNRKMISDAEIITKNTFEVKRLWDGQCACREGMDPKKGGEGQKTVRCKGAVALSGNAWCERELNGR